MKKVLFLILSLFLQAATLNDFFDELERHPSISALEKELYQLELKEKELYERFYPKATIFVDGEYYSNDTNLRPVPPTEANSLIQNRQPLPFAKRMWRYGIMGEWLLYSKSLLKNIKSVQQLIKVQVVKDKIELLNLQSALVTLIANIHYIDALQSAIKAHQRSLQKSLEDVKLKVSLEKSPPISQQKIENALIELQQKEIALLMQKEALKNSLYALVKSKKAPKIKLIAIPQKGEPLALQADRYLIKAAQHSFQASLNKFMPIMKVDFTATHVASDQDLLFDRHVERYYGSIKFGLYLPIAKTDFTDIEKKKIQWQKQKLKYEALQRELIAQQSTLKQQLQLLEKALELDRANLHNQEKLLRYAKVAYKVGRMNTEEYLRYEAALENAKSQLASDRKKRIELAVKLAVLYGKDLRTIVRDEK